MNIVLKNIDLSVNDVAQSMQFYAEVMGLANTPQSAPPHMMILQAGGVTLSLHQTGTQGGKPVQPGSVELGFACDDIDAMRARILEAGMECTSVRQYDFGKSFDARDPDGYALSVYCLRP